MIDFRVSTALADHHHLLLCLLQLRMTRHAESQCPLLSFCLQRSLSRENDAVVSCYPQCLLVSVATQITQRRICTCSQDQLDNDDKESQVPISAQETTQETLHVHHDVLLTTFPLYYSVREDPLTSS